MKFSPRMVRLCLTLMAILALLLASVSFVASELKSKAAGASNHTYYVSKSGNNADGLSWSTAWNELANINWSVVQPGDTILLDGGQTNMTYTSTLTIGTGGTQAAPITIERATEAGHNGKVILFGGRTTPLPYCGQSTYTNQTSGVLSSGIAVNGKSWIVIDGISWDGISISGFSSNGVAVSTRYGSASTASNDTFRNLEISDNGSASQQSNGTWIPKDSGDGVAVAGSNLTFAQMNIHDNADDNFEPGPVNSMTIEHSWLHEAREDPTRSGLPWNQCVHQDGFQIWTGGVQGGITIQDSILGPGLMDGVILGQTPTNPYAGATVNNVTLKNDLILDTTGNNILGYPQISSQNWTIQNVTSFTIAPNVDGNTPNNIFLEGPGHKITSSIFYGGHIGLPTNTTNSGNCVFNTSGNTVASNGQTIELINGQNVDPNFVTNVSGFTNATSLATLANANFALQQSSPCSGVGSSITSVAQLINTATTSQPAPAGVGSTSTAVPTAAPTDPPVPTIAPTSTPILQPASTPPPILWTPDPSSTTPVPLPSTSSDLVLYGDAGATGFVDHSFGYSSHNPCDTSLFVSPPCSYAISYRSYGAINFYHPNGAISTASYQALQYDLNTNHQPITDFSALFLNSQRRVIQQIRLSAADVTAQLPGGWVQISIPLSVLNPANVAITGIQLKNRTRWHLAPIHVDDVQLVAF
jgi:hypothetical protein